MLKYAKCFFFRNVSRLQFPWIVSGIIYLDWFLGNGKWSENKVVVDLSSTRVRSTLLLPCLYSTYSCKYSQMKCWFPTWMIWSIFRNGHRFRQYILFTKGFYHSSKWFFFWLIKILDYFRMLTVGFTT